MRRSTRFAVLAGLAVVGLPAAARGQLPAAAVTAMHVDTVEGGIDTSYAVTINGAAMLAISARRARSIAQTDIDLRDARATLQALEADTAALKAFRRQADSTVGIAQNLITRMEAQLGDYKELTNVYRRLAAEEVLSVELGVGVTDFTDPRGALLGGVGYRHVRVWGFAQKDNTGMAVGMHFRLF